MDNILNVNHYFSYMIFPFKTNASFNDVLELKKERTNGKKINIWEESRLILENAQDSFASLFDMRSADRNIVKQFRLNPNIKRDFGLQNNNYLYFNDASEVIKIKTDAFNLYMFENGIGFFTIKLIYDTQDINTCIRLNYNISEVKRKDSKFYFTKESAENKNSEESILLLDYMKKMLADYIEVEDFDNSTALEYFNRRPLLFSYMLLEKKPEEKELDETLFNARLNYKFSYKCAKSNYGIVKSFDNSYWGVSLNGLVNISYLTEDEKTNKFFKGEFIQRLQGLYLAMHLYVLNKFFMYQKMRNKYLELNPSLIIEKENEFKKKIENGEFDRKTLSEAKRNQAIYLAEYCEKTEVLNAEALLFSLRCNCFQPSNVEHINDLFKTLNNVYLIQEGQKQLEVDIKQAKEIGAKFEQRLDTMKVSLKELRRAKSELIIYAFISVLGLTGTFKSVLEVIEILSESGNIFKNTQMIITLVIMIIPTVALIVSTINKISEWQEKKSKFKKNVAE